MSALLAPAPRSPGASPRSPRWSRRRRRRVTIVLDVPDWPGHVAGQHVDVRLTAPRRLPGAALLLDRLRPRGRAARADGRADRRRRGLALPGRRAAGRRRDRAARPDRRALLLAGRGRRAAAARRRRLRARAADVDAPPPRRARQRRRRAAARVRRAGSTTCSTARSSRRWPRGPGLAVHRTLTRERPDGWDGCDRRVDREMLEAVGPAPAERPRVFVCGPTGFVEQVADALVDARPRAGRDPRRALRTDGRLR